MRKSLRHLGLGGIAVAAAFCTSPCGPKQKPAAPASSTPAPVGTQAETTLEEESRRATLLLGW